MFSVNGTHRCANLVGITASVLRVRGGVNTRLKSECATAVLVHTRFVDVICEALERCWEYCTSDLMYFTLVCHQLVILQWGLHSHWNGPWSEYVCVSARLRCFSLWLDRFLKITTLTECVRSRVERVDCIPQLDDELKRTWELYWCLSKAWYFRGLDGLPGICHCYLSMRLCATELTHTLVHSLTLTRSFTHELITSTHTLAIPPPSTHTRPHTFIFIFMSITLTAISIHINTHTL